MSDLYHQLKHKQTSANVYQAQSGSVNPFQGARPEIYSASNLMGSQAVQS